MHPATLSLLESLPRTPNGKIDREALPQPQVSSAPAAAPASATERQLAQLWCSILGLTSIDRTANFFEIGGHSLAAARLAARIEAQFNRRLALSTLFECPTLDQQAALLEHAEPRRFDFRQVVRLQTQGLRTPLIALNNTGSYYLLAKRLGSDQPFTCLQLFDPSNADIALPDSMESLAKAYVSLIQEVQPEGPYALVGWCVAGVLAFEVARQLAAAGQQISLLAMIDTWTPGHVRRRGRVTDYAYRWQLIRRELRSVRRGQLSLAQFIGNRNLVRTLRRFARRVPAGAAAIEGSEERSPAEHDQWLLDYLQRMSDRYEPEPFDGKILLFRSKEEPQGLFIDWQMGWGPFARGGVDTVVLPGDHYTVFHEPGVSGMAEFITAQAAAESERQR